ncbi:phytanoyl-CoA dioxygenase family protein [Paenibacillus thermotolerans]|uniref:phytanoyl-CoA dioxygenase family protein n=1 Tax=Paenibacillus thermotolerans TaxID=3027807 RepID=UPI00236768B4|nr:MULTISPECIES: phytanoyl-CoA dioxygenase family protein [unclassified Paenibacillus]
MKLSKDELESGMLRPDTLELAVNLVKVNGFVLFEEAISREIIDDMYAKYLDILNPYLEAHGDEIYNQQTGFNAGTNHIRLFLPFIQPFIDSVIIDNPIAMAVIDRILGDDCILNYFATNTSLPGGTKCQPVHSDAGAMFGNRCSFNLPVTDLVLNVPLVDVDENNGPLEIWPGGTHLLPDYTNGPNPPFNKDELAVHMQSLKVFMPAGSIVIRDMRTWHRGTPNRSNAPRPNMALVYSAANSKVKGNIRIPQETYDLLSEKAQRLLRFEKIGHNVIEPYH